MTHCCHLKYYIIKIKRNLERFMEYIDAKKIVNVTAGLPFVRTSPGHGTAFDIAGKNITSEVSMMEAIKVAAKYAPAFSEEAKLELFGNLKFPNNSNTIN